MNTGQNKIKGLLEKEAMSEAEYSYLLSLIRKQLEIINDTSSFDYVKLFCDWALHAEISKSSTGSFLVASINTALNAVKDSDTDQVIKKISSSLMTKFREQIRNFLVQTKMSPAIVDGYQSWIDFLRNILEIISHSPVILKAKHEADVASNPLKAGMWAQAVSIVKINFDKLVNENSTSEKETYCLMVFTSDSTKIVVPITPAI
ncbi:MAG: hypothetical protein HYU97_03310 [Deltaproteobacteria bacterium]|nr:hypothetical protein [Deltaproteobacteria bacterium]